MAETRGGNAHEKERAQARTAAVFEVSAYVTAEARRLLAREAGMRVAAGARAVARESAQRASSLCCCACTGALKIMRMVTRRARKRSGRRPRARRTRQECPSPTPLSGGHQR